MKKDDFQEDTRYTVTLRDEHGKYRPAKFYVLKRHDQHMIVRLTEKHGLLRKIAYRDVLRIVDSKPVAQTSRYAMPEALLSERLWQERQEMQHYGSSPGMGK